MDQLLELALRNWFVVIIIIAVLSSFRRLKRSGTATGDRTNRMPSFGGGESPSAQSSPTPLQSRGASPFGGSSPFGSPPVARDFSYVEPDEEEEEEYYDDFTQAMRSRVIPKTSMSNKVSHSLTPSAALQRSSLKQAVAWAEIIGPPRAKRPYRPR